MIVQFQSNQIVCKEQKIFPRLCIIINICAKLSYQLLVRDEFDTDHICLTEVNSSMKQQSKTAVVEKTPRTESCAVRVTAAVKRRQGSSQPFREFALLIDAAPRNIQMREGSTCIFGRKKHQDTSISLPQRDWQHLDLNLNTPLSPLMLFRGAKGYDYV